MKSLRILMWILLVIVAPDLWISILLPSIVYILYWLIFYFIYIFIGCMSVLKSLVPSVYETSIVNLNKYFKKKFNSKLFKKTLYLIIWNRNFTPYKVTLNLQLDQNYTVNIVKELKGMVIHFKYIYIYWNIDIFKQS